MIRICKGCGKEFEARRNQYGYPEYCSNPECRKEADRESSRKSYWKDPEKSRESKRKSYRKYYKKNSEKIRESSRKYYKENPEYYRKYTLHREHTEPMFKLKMSIGRSIYNSLKGNKNGYHWEDLVGYTQEDLRTHLERQFKKGMNWENYGEWHIDHIRPIASFNFSSPHDPDFKKCWALSNLQPLWGSENISKSSFYKGKRYYKASYSSLSEANR